MEAGGTKFANTTVWAAMIQTDPTVAGVLGRDFHKVPQGVNGTAVDNAWARVEHAKKMTVDLPFNVAFWWSVYAPNCPSRNAKGNDRGVSMAHYQIWADFEFQGRHKRGKDRLIASDRDVLIVFEDDAVIAVKDVNASLEIEISKMNTDLLFLGWCYGRRGMPMCTHAYALTRGAIKKILKEWDSCTISSIDGQWKTMVADGIFTWKKANQNSYKDLKEGFGDNPAYFTRGIFVQKNGMVSFNHHGFQNNAG
eukprot:CAMPEP_0119039714 /NCGR_PEP_ID=MMETSP1177-20130426/9336_1 /TAXON_ID=2985 /ORGANISM="Ochromonas sp, Strain CCMP1899" /LENGTH=251 /DNA_ID=CAMNT_0007003925 /DNA_START=550 /DNA_END=1305 /DNA_ORIENTATION=-